MIPKACLILQKLVQESSEDVEVALFLEPDGVEEKTKWSTIAAVMTIEVILQHAIHLFVRQVCGTGINHTAKMSYK